LSLNNRKAAAPIFSVTPQTQQEEQKSIIPRPRRSRPSVKRLSTYNQVVDPNSIDIDKIHFQEDKATPHGKSVYKRLIGFVNLGNTCYMNSTLQCLIHSDMFIKRFVSERKRFSSNKFISKKFYELLRLIYEQEKEHSYISPIEFKQAISILSDNYKGYSQQDSQEFCRVFLEQINQELNRVEVKSPYRELNRKGKSKQQLNAEYEMLCKKREDSIITDTFYGQFINIFVCLGCEHESYSFEKFFDIPLIFEGSSNDSVSNLIKNYFQDDILKWDTPCENCGRKTEHSKTIKIGKLPDLLCISIQRFDEVTLSKSDNSVYVDDYINLRDYIDTQCLGKVYY
jgi:ubiquitin C-terminal hydrolase